MFDFISQRIGLLKLYVDIGALSPSKVPATVILGTLSAILPRDMRLRNSINERYVNKVIWPFMKYYSSERKIFDIHGIKIPPMPPHLLLSCFVGFATEHGLFHCQEFDAYDGDWKDYCKKIGDTPYCYPIENGNVLIQSNDIVIDAGAWIGDFSAYCVMKGADKVYAFEPVKESLFWLYQFADLNPGIFPVELGLSNKKESVRFAVNGASVGNKISESGNVMVNLTTIDDFVMEQKLPRVDFIKADIEGAERNMLLGASQTLKEFAPKLSLCTYHLPDDPQVLEKVIKEINPNYTIFHAARKMYAYDARRNK